jgi:hypothetical protein
MAQYTITASADATTEIFELSGDNGAFSYQAEATGLDASDGVLSVEYSNDRENFDQVPNLTEIVASGASSTHFNVNVINHKYYRVSWVSNSNTAGTITVTLSR